jgi:hypothetical protein
MGQPFYSPPPHRKGIKLLFSFTHQVAFFKKNISFPQIEDPGEFPVVVIYQKPESIDVEEMKRLAAAAKVCIAHCSRDPGRLSPDFPFTCINCSIGNFLRLLLHDTTIFDICLFG